MGSGGAGEGEWRTACRFRRGRTARRVAALALALAAWSSSPATAQTTPVFPDLVTARPTDVRLATLERDGAVRFVVRFTNEVLNAGDGALELQGRPTASGDRVAVVQTVYERPVGLHQVPVGEFVWHPEHDHFHFADFARYELWTRSEFARAVRSGYARGRPLAVHAKVGFCLFDFGHAQPDRGPPFSVYRGCDSSLLMGLSPGWSDTYAQHLPDQWVDVGTSPLADGHYVLRSVSDVANRLFESEAKADPAREGQVANAGVAAFQVENGVLVQSPAGDL